MNAWESYTARMNTIGVTRRDAAKNREAMFLERKLPASLSHFPVLVDGVPQDVAIINTDNLNEKFAFSLPGEDIQAGSLLFWEDNYWLATERDAADEVYTRVKITQCNYLLKWVDTDSNIHEQWCVVEDGTKLTRAPVRMRTKWFGVLETARKKNLLLCWNTLRAMLPKRSGEQLQTATV